METDRRLRDGGILCATKAADAKAARKPSEKAAAATAAAAKELQSSSQQIHEVETLLKRRIDRTGAFPYNP